MEFPYCPPPGFILCLHLWERKNLFKSPRSSLSIPLSHMGSKAKLFCPPILSDYGLQGLTQLKVLVVKQRPYSFVNWAILYTVIFVIATGRNAHPPLCIWLVCKSAVNGNEIRCKDSIASAGDWDRDTSSRCLEVWPPFTVWSVGLND